MFSILNALGPVFLTVMSGALLNRMNFPGAGFWPLAERFTYFVLFPSLLVYKLASSPFSSVASGAIIWSAVLPLMILSAILLAFSRWLAINGPDFTSLFQGSIRFNTYVGLAAAEQLFGEAGLIIAALTISVMIPLVNLLCVTVFALKTGKDAGMVKGLFRDITTNPLILGCLVGILLNVSGVGLPFWSEPFLSILSQPALPLGLLAVGAGLNLANISSSRSPVLLSSLIKLLLLPVIAAWVCSWVGVEGVVRQVIVLFFCLPTAPSAFILARQLGGNAPLMATIITAQALLAMVTMPFIMWWLGGL
jgi:malonate transporter and related proteins